MKPVMGIHRGEKGQFVTIEEDGHTYFFSVACLPPDFMVDLWNWINDPDHYEPPLLDVRYMATNPELVATDS